MADSGHRTCLYCANDLSDMLNSIANRYDVLNAKPAGVQELGGRGAPGFGSRAPASEHIIAMMDPRSSEVARIWKGSDGRIHSESERPPMSVYSTLLTEVYDVAERRNMSLPEMTGVRNLAEWLLRHIDWITRQESVSEFHDTIKRLERQLKPLTGDPAPHRVGNCPQPVERNGQEVRCDSVLYVPEASDTVTCRGCKSEWRRPEWAQLGGLLEAS